MSSNTPTRQNSGWAEDIEEEFQRVPEDTSNSGSLDFDTLTMEDGELASTLICGDNPRVHLLNCNHHVATDGIQPCGPNCSQMAPASRDQHPFYCIACYVKMQHYYVGGKFTVHTATLSREPTLDEYKTWFYGGIHLEDEINMLIGSAHLAAQTAYRRTSPVDCFGEPETYSPPPNWVDWACGDDLVVCVNGEPVYLTDGVWRAASDEQKEVFLRLAYNRRCWWENGRIWMQGILLERRGDGDGPASEVIRHLPSFYWGMKAAYVGRSKPEPLMEEDAAKLARIEKELAEDDVVSLELRLDIDLGPNF